MELLKLEHEESESSREPSFADVMGASSSENGGTPIAGWFISWNPIYKWMMTGDPHDYGHLQIGAAVTWGEHQDIIGRSVEKMGEPEFVKSLLHFL